MKINRISPQDIVFLKVLSNIAKSPDTLYYTGKLPAMRPPVISIVGTRKPTAYGKETTHRFAESLARRGIVIVSGLALGVDGIAHRAALQVGGTTIAILGNGLPDIYPASHRQLAVDIVDAGGALLTEYKQSTPALPHQFLARNRLVSGLADAILITEAAARSGTLNTAAHALEQGKDVFVIPGNITSPMSAGCNALIRQGATPVSDPEQILEVIAPTLLEKQTVLSLGATPSESVILKLLATGIRDGDLLQQQSGLETSEFSTTLTMLELNGQIRALGANQWTTI